MTNWLRWRRCRRRNCAANGCNCSAALRRPSAIAWLALVIAHRLQEKAKGGLPAKLTREIDTMVRQLEKGEEIKASASATLRPGTQLVRERRGSTHRVMILDDAYLTGTSATAR